MQIFDLQVVSLDGQIFKGEVVSLAISTKDGDVVIMANHMPIITPVKAGELIITRIDGKDIFAIGGGMLEITQKSVVILIDEAVHIDNILVQRAEEARARAAEIMQKKEQQERVDDDQAFAHAAAEMAKAMVQIKVARKYKHSSSIR